MALHFHFVLGLMFCSWFLMDIRGATVDIVKDTIKVEGGG